ncbi:MAG: response regulator transcription factor [Clostridiales bacterium]|nr:response regulator transcription factor [Clostridiales bacterium]
MRILIIEDEVRLARTLADMAAQDGYATDIAYDGESGLDNAMTGVYDAVVLDVMLPKLNGFDLLKRLRAEGIATPVLMLTAKAELTDRVRGLDFGADYYLTKPFENAEFRACLRAVTRRQSEIIPEQLAFGDLTLIPSDSRLSRAEQSLSLSMKEMEIMRLLILNQKSILSKETLLVKVWGYNTDAGDNNVEAYISFLRKKLFLLGSSVEIQAIRRQGYRLEAKP